MSSFIGNSNLRKYYPYEVIYRSEIQLGLRKLAVVVRPHMRTDDSDFQDRLISSPVGDEWILEIDRRNSFDNGNTTSDKFAGPHMLSLKSLRFKHRNRECSNYDQEEDTYLRLDTAKSGKEGIDFGPKIACPA
jgi:hypothetical protein